MNILFSLDRNIVFLPGEAAGVPDLTPILPPRQSYFMRRGFGDLSRCLILNQFFKKFNFSGITYLCRTRAESFFQKIPQILLYAKFASPVPLVRYVTLYIRKVYDKSFYLNIFYYKAFLRSLICSHFHNREIIAEIFFFTSFK